MNTLYTTILICLIVFSTTTVYPQTSKEVSKPLLRIFPIFRKEECDMAIRFDICLKCIRREEQYAQKIFFYEDGLVRVHGCFTDESGFVILE